MLIGPSTRPILPRVPDLSYDLKAVIAYLQDLDKALSTFQSAIVANAIGLNGVRGLSSTGVTAQNFVHTFNISNLTQMIWTFTSFEADASYLCLTMQSKQTWDSFVTETSRTTSNITFTFGGAVASGTIMHCVLLR